MKNAFFLLLMIILPYAVNSQVVTEKTLVKFENITEADPYSFSYDEKTGTYLYMVYDSTKNPANMVMSNKGNTDWYDYIDYFSAVFDDKGNYYTTANKKINDTTYNYYFLRNGNQELQYEYISSELALNNGKIYFLCNDKGKAFITAYDIIGGSFSKGKEYNEIVLCEFGKMPYEGEPIGKIGFTKDGKPYYIAKSDGFACLVIGDLEQKHYSDIEAYNFISDAKGNFAYTAKDTGNFMNSGGAFVVYNEKHFKPFSYVYNLILDNKGEVYYIATDESADASPQRIMRGDKVLSKTYSGGVYNLGFTKDNKMYFIASEKKKNSEEYESFIVFDGKEGKRYQSIFSVKEMQDGSLLYTGLINENKSVIIKGEDEISISKNNLVSAEILKDGRLAYTTAQYGNYETKVKDKYYVNIEDKSFGPYDGLQTASYMSPEYLLSDSKGNYAYIVNGNRNFEEYYSVVYWKGGKSDEFDYIQDINLVKGKPLYISAKSISKDSYINTQRLYYGNKPLTVEYSALNFFKFDEKTLTATFAVTKGNELVKVEVKF